MPSRAQRRLAHAGRALAPLQASAAAAAIAPPDPPASSAAELSPIPSIDVSSLFGEDLDAKLHTAREIAAACEDIGFFSIYNHGVPREVIAAAWEQTAAFFALPEATKLDGTTMTDDYPYGYLPLGGEKLAAGKQHELGSDDDSGEVDEPPGDLNESFSIGPPDRGVGRAADQVAERAHGVQGSVDNILPGDGGALGRDPASVRARARAAGRVV
eukprot:COSAG06_NODE_11233_length_1541_cov_1.310680_2_plen_214_part_00